MDYAKESLRLHKEWKGKIEVTATVPVATREDLSLAYTPGVAQPCLEIEKDVNLSYELTRRWNLWSDNRSSLLGRERVLGGRYWVRTSDLFGVNEARYHCANRPKLPLYTPCLDSAGGAGVSGEKRCCATGLEGCLGEGCKFGCTRRDASEPLRHAHCAN